MLRAWAARESPFWYRRIALVATVSLNDGLGGPTQRRLRRIGRVPPIGESPRPQLTFDLLEASIHDRRHFIRLGIGWALRPLSAVDPDGVAAFVQRHRAKFTKAMLNKARLDDDGRRDIVISLILDTDVGDDVTTAAPTPARRSYPPTSRPRAG